MDCVGNTYGKFGQHQQNSENQCQKEQIFDLS